MGRKGFSLIELLVTIGIISFLLAIATINFNQWIRRTNVEKEVKEIYADLMYVRQQALVTGMRHEVEFNSTTRLVFRSYSSEKDAVGTVIRDRTLPYPIRISDSSDTKIDFNSRGMMIEIIPKSVCVYSEYNPPLDSIYITKSRINLGKIKNQGSSCEKANITLK
jgi:prepilin-type N-terminal cleavage/methylation domain-containing protein